MCRALCDSSISSHSYSITFARNPHSLLPLPFTPTDFRSLFHPSPPPLSLHSLLPYPSLPFTLPPSRPPLPPSLSPPSPIPSQPFGSFYPSLLLFLPSLPPLPCPIPSPPPPGFIPPGPIFYGPNIGHLISPSTHKPRAWIRIRETNKQTNSKQSESESGRGVEGGRGGKGGEGRGRVRSLRESSASGVVWRA